MSGEFSEQFEIPKIVDFQTTTEFVAFEQHSKIKFESEKVD